MVPLCDLKSDVLESIQVGSGSDPPACLASMVTEWLKRNYNVQRFGEPTWQRLVEAVGHPAGGANMAVARDIARRHKAGGKLHKRASIIEHNAASPSWICPLEVGLCYLPWKPSICFSSTCNRSTFFPQLSPSHKSLPTHMMWDFLLNF